MDQLVFVALAGFAASLVDGALGMGFGPTSSSILLGAGVSPVSTSTTVNLAKIVTGITGGAAHWHAGNVDRRLVVRLAGPAVIGAVVGATVLTRVDGDTIRPVLALMLLLVGVRLLVRFANPVDGSCDEQADGLAAVNRGSWGFRAVAATGGLTNGLVGTWGPVVTPYLLHRRVAPRTVVGSVNTSEIVVALVSAGSLVGLLGAGGVELPIVLAMLGGGVLAAPVSAHLVRFIAPRVLGLSMAGLLLVTQTRELALALGVPVVAAMVAATASAAVIAAGSRVLAGGGFSGRTGRQAARSAPAASAEGHR